MGVDLPLTQLIGHTEDHETFERLPDGTWANYDYDWMLEHNSMEQVRTWADGIGPDLTMLVRQGTQPGSIAATDLADEAHAAGLYVTPWTVRVDQLPSCAPSVDALVAALVQECRVDGIITDFPDRVLRALGRS